MVAASKPPGLKRVSRAGRVALYWACSASARAAGYPVKTVPLATYADDPAELALACQRLQGDMLVWLAGTDAKREPYDGTMGGLLRAYQTDPESSFRKLRPSSLRPYRTYARRLENMIGERRIANVTGLDVQRWFKVWSQEGKFIGAARFALAVLKAALAFGAISGKLECQRLREVISLMRFDSLNPREHVFTADQIDAIREHARPSVALATAMQFETAIRLWDIIGQWLPMSEPGISPVTFQGKKWFGLTWADIGPDNVLRLMPSKTVRRTGKRVTIDLSLCPMVVEEMARIPMDRRTGPLVIDESTGRPYLADAYRRAWRKAANKAGISKQVWCRDIRASAITEGRSHGVAIEDAGKVAGHVKPKITAEVYDRDRLAAARRFSTARVEGRNRPKT